MKKKLLLWFMQSGLYKWLLIKVIPYIRFTTYYPSLRGKKYHEGYAKLRAGDIILTRDNKKLTTLLIGGDFTHAALCIALNYYNNPGWEVSEMTHENYTKSFFFDICKEADRVVILRCHDWDLEYLKKVIEQCISLQSAQYDIEFELGVKALYCSELVYQSDFEKRLKVDLTDIAGLGRPYLSPTGIYKAKNIDLVWDSASL